MAPAAQVAAAIVLAEAVVGTYFTAQDIRNTMSEVQEDQIRGLSALNKIITTEHARQLVTSLILPRVIHLFIHSDSEPVRDAAIWVLTNLAASPGVYGAVAVWGSGAELQHAMVDVLREGSRRLKSETFWCLANIAASHPDFGNAMVVLDLHTISFNAIADVANAGRLRKNAAFLLGNLAKYLDEGRAGALLDQMMTLPPIVYTDTLAMVDLMWAINVLQFRAQNLENISCTVLVERLSHQDARVVNPALLTIDNVCAGSNRSLIKEMLRVGVVPALRRLLGRRVFRADVLRTFSNLAVEIEGADAMIREPNLLYEINELVSVSIDAIWIICNMATRGLIRHVRAMIGCGCAAALVRAVPDINELGLRLIVEGLLAILQKDGSTAHRALNEVGFEAVLDRLSGHESEYVRRYTEEMLEVWRGLESPAAAPTPALPPAAFAVAMRGRYTVSPQTRLAIDRVAEEMSRGEHMRWVSVGDLLFTAPDIAYITGLGYMFDIEGRLGLNDAQYALRAGIA